MLTRNKVRTSLAVVGCTLLLVAGCRTMPPVGPSAADSAALVAVVIEPGVLGLSRSAQNIYLVPVNSDKDDFTGKTVISATYYNRNRVYLLNAKPGKYAMIGYFVVQKSQNSTTNLHFFFDKESIAKTVFEVKSGQLSAIKIDSEVTGSGSFGDFTPVQKHYQEKIAPGSTGMAGLGKAVLAGMLGGVVTASGAAKTKLVLKGQEALNKLKADIVEDWKETPWARMAPK